MLVLLHFFIALSMHSYICIVAPHLGTLDVRRVDVKHAVWSRTTRRCLADISRRRNGPKKQPKTRPKVGRAQGLDSFNTNLVLPSGKPRCTSYYFKLWHLYIYASITCALGLGIVWNPRCMIPRFPWSYTSMYRTIEMLCLIVLDRSRVTSCTREI